MACYSRITKTQMKDQARLEAALKAEGWQIVASNERGVTARRDERAFGSYGERMNFTRAGASFQTDSSNRVALQAVQRKYTEIAVRDFARSRGLTIQSENGGTKLTLTNRRG